MRTEGPFEADTSGRSWWLPLVAMVNAVFVVLSRDHYPEALLLAGFGVFGWLGFRRFRTGSPWLVLALYHGLLLGWRLFEAPNHHFVLFYLALVIGLFKESPKELGAQCRRLFALVFAVSLIQKGLRPEFVNGAFIEFSLLKGDFFPWLQWSASHFDEITTHNQQAVHTFLATDPQVATSLTLRRWFPASLMLGLVSTWAIALSELAVVWGSLRWADRRLYHGGVLLFIGLLVLTRSEFLFASILGCLALGFVPTREIRLRKAYGGGISLLLALACLS